MADVRFYAKQSAPSQAKARIVSNYFDAWASVVQGAARERGLPVGYLDLFAGRGEYEDGAESTPLLVLKKAINNPKYRDLMVAQFNECNPQHAEALRAAIQKLPGLKLLRRLPEVFTEEVGEKVAAHLADVGPNLPPTLTFMDPFGYKGLTRRLVQSVVQSWGSEIILFFNFNRVNAALSHPNESICHHIDVLFGSEEAESLRRRVGDTSSPVAREQMVLDQFMQGLKANDVRYAQHFGFSTPDGRTSHHLVHVTKSRKGHHLMKDIMGRASSSSSDGVPSFRYGSAPAPGPDLFSECYSPLDELKQCLLAKFAGQRLTIERVWQQHSIGRQYLLKNYKSAIYELQASGEIGLECPAGQKWKKNTMPDWLVVHFGT